MPLCKQFIVRATPFFLIRFTFTNVMMVSSLKMVMIYKKKNRQPWNPNIFLLKASFLWMGISLGREHGVAKRSGISWFFTIFRAECNMMYLKTNAIVFILYTGYKKLSNDQELSGTAENFQGLFLDFWNRESKLLKTSLDQLNASPLFLLYH